MLMSLDITLCISYVWTGMWMGERTTHSEAAPGPHKWVWPTSAMADSQRGLLSLWALLLLLLLEHDVDSVIHYPLFFQLEFQKSEFSL